MSTQQTISTLNQLIRTCRDNEDLGRACAGAADDSALRALLHAGGTQWGRWGDELQALVLLLGGAPATGGTVGARARRTWLGARTAMFGRSDPTALEPWRDAQRRALERYRQALDYRLPERIRRTLALQADQVRDHRASAGRPCAACVLPSRGG